MSMIFESGKNGANLVISSQNSTCWTISLCSDNSSIGPLDRTDNSTVEIARLFRQLKGRFFQTIRQLDLGPRKVDGLLYYYYNIIYLFGQDFNKQDTT